VVFRESHGLDEVETPIDLGQSPGDLVVLSFSDSDLRAFAAGWKRARDLGTPLPSLRLANLGSLKHPVSVDTYVEQTLQGAKAILVRLIGGVPYWEYGLSQVRALAEARGISLAVLPGDGRADAQLEAISTVPRATLDRLNALCGEGGAVAGQAALAQLALAAGFYTGPVPGAKTIPDFGCWTPERGARDGVSESGCGACGGECPVGLGKPVVALVFYRAYLAASDMAPVEALFQAFRVRGFAPIGLFVPSLKAQGAATWIETRLDEIKPVAIINATAFSGKSATGTSPLDIAKVPVFQVALATSTKGAWAEADRGLSPADLAMHVVLPEVDGRIFGGVASFKEMGAVDADLELGLYAHRPVPDRIDAIADRAAAWIGLSTKPKDRVSLALVLSTYPGKDWQMAHAVGLDALASGEVMLSDLADAGYMVAQGRALETSLAEDTLTWTLAEYHDALTALPVGLQQDLMAAWGLPEDDSSVFDGAFRFPAVKRGHVLVALQPERGFVDARRRVS